MAWLNLTMSNQTVKKGIKAKKIKLPQMNFFLEKQLIKFSCTYWALSFCKIFKNFLGPIQSYKNVPFSGPKWSICPFRPIKLSVYFRTTMRPSISKYNLVLDILNTLYLLILNQFSMKLNWKSILKRLTFMAASVLRGRQYTGMGTASWPGVSLAYVEGKLQPYACFLPSKQK